MRAQQHIWNAEDGWCNAEGTGSVTNPQIVLYFAAPGTASQSECFNELKQRYPNAHIIGCTTGGEILASDVLDSSVVATSIEFEKTKVEISSGQIEATDESYSCGQKIGNDLFNDDLATVFVLCDGIRVNGSELVRGIIDVIGSDIPITGGMAGDGDRFEMTLVGLDSEPKEGKIVAFGLYGDSVTIGHGSVGGWDVFGPERVITKSQDNVLYELDGEPALELYKKYLGDEAQNLPGSGLLFPLKIHPVDALNKDVVRTIVGIDEQNQSLIFAGNIPQNYNAQLMRGNFEHLIEGAASAAESAMKTANGSNKVAIMVSCIGRKLLMGQRITEEIEAASEILGLDTIRTGFYSYGEISPHEVSGVSDLHNQTMTVTVYSEN